MAKNEGTITRRASRVLNDLQDQFKGVCCKADFERVLQKLRRAAKSEYPSVRAQVCDMLENCGIACEKENGKAAYYEALVQKADIPDTPEDAMLYALYQSYEDYPSPKEYMKRLVDRLEDPEDGWAEDSLRLRILKRFIKYGNYLRDWDFGGKKAAGIVDYSEERLKKQKKWKEKAKLKAENVQEVLEGLDDDIFLVLKDAKESPIEPESRYGLLRAAEDLAEGRFYTGGATRRLLYLFAMAYNMTYYCPQGVGQLLRYESDLERNLFQDYYVNNLTRYLSPSYLEKPSAYEKDPSGQGINYKNFAEMVCLYYISQDESEVSSQEKLRRSHEMISRLRERAKKEKPSPAIPAGKGKTVEKGTALYRGNFTEDLLDRDEEEFETFLWENYDCDPKGGGVFEIGSDQNTAFGVYSEILEDLDEVMSWTGLSRESCNYGLCFTDVGAEEKDGLSNFPVRWRGEAIDRRKYDRLLGLLQRVNDLVGVTFEEEESDRSQEGEKKEISIRKTKALYISDPGKVTRTILLTAFYYLYNAREEAGDAAGQDGNFREGFWDFKKEADPYLNRAGYQEVSGKNIFDVLLAFSAYARQNI